LIADHPLVDVGELLLDKEARKLVGVAVDGMKPEIYYFDAEYAKLQATLDASFPGQRVNFQWRGNRVVVSTTVTKT
jgi:hypothetical protein